MTIITLQLNLECRNAELKAFQLTSAMVCSTDKRASLYYQDLPNYWCAFKLHLLTHLTLHGFRRDEFAVVKSRYCEMGISGVEGIVAFNQTTVAAG